MTQQHALNAGTFHWGWDQVLSNDRHGADDAKLIDGRCYELLTLDEDKQQHSCPYNPSLSTASLYVSYNVMVK